MERVSGKKVTKILRIQSKRWHVQRPYLQQTGHEPPSWNHQWEQSGLTLPWQNQAEPEPEEVPEQNTEVQKELSVFNLNPRLDQTLNSFYCRPQLQARRWSWSRWQQSGSTPSSPSPGKPSSSPSGAASCATRTASPSVGTSRCWTFSSRLRNLPGTEASFCQHPGLRRPEESVKKLFLDFVSFPADADAWSGRS